MSDAKQDESIYYHSLNVAILSMLIAKELEWDRSEIETVGLSALFHDVGKLKVPPQILKNRPLGQRQSLISSSSIRYLG